jgi:hypothetical protein
MVFVAACGQGRASSTPERVRVLSLRQELPHLDKAAESWRSDAYLVNAQIELPGSRMPDLVFAVYRSRTSATESVFVRLMTSGHIEIEPISHDGPLSALEPIEAGDWALDAQAALDAMLDDEGRRFLLGASGHCSFLTLERALAYPGDPVVWRLTLRGCPGLEARHVVIDANTGEMFGEPPTPTPWPWVSPQP